MVRIRVNQQDNEVSTADTRRSTRIQAHTTNAIASASSAVSRPVRQFQNAVTTMSDNPKISTRNKRNNEGINEKSIETSVNPAKQPTTAVEYRRPSATFSRNVFKQPSTATVKARQAASSITTQDNMVPQVTAAIQQFRKRGRPPKTTLTSDPAATLKPKRRKGDTFTVSIPTCPKRIGQVYAIGSNDISQCGMAKDYKIQKISIIPMEQFNIVDISAGAFHSAALTLDGKVVTWGCNDHGKLVNHLLLIHLLYLIIIFTSI